MKRVICFAMLYSLGLSSIAFSAQAENGQIKKLDSEIAEFEKARDGYEMRAYMAGDRADWLIDQDWMGYKRALEKESEYHKNVTLLDQKIDKLKKQKAELQAKLT